MTEQLCELIADKLVGYADNELPPDEAAVGAEHLTGCEQCRATLEALRRSLDAATAIWQEGEADLADLRVPSVPRSRWLPQIRSGLVAASIVLLVTGLLAWRFAGTTTQPTISQSGAQTLADIQRGVERAGMSAQLLAAADTLIEQPGGERIAREQYRYITTRYPETDAAQAANKRLRSLATRRTQG